MFSEAKTALKVLAAAIKVLVAPLKVLVAASLKVFEPSAKCSLKRRQQGRLTRSVFSKLFLALIEE